MRTDRQTDTHTRFMFYKYRYKTWILSVCLCVCLSVHVFLSHQKSQLHEILAQGVIWAWFEHDEARFLNFSFLRILGAFFVFFKMRFLVFFSKISAILTPRTMKFGHKDYFYTEKWHKKNYRKISIFRAFFRCFFIHKFKNDVFVHDFLSH